MKIGIVRFPGSNCDRDVFSAIEAGMGWQAGWLEHCQPFLPTQFDGYIISGGFSYGDYLRAGALAALSPVMESLKEVVAMGQPVLGICNGFQVLCEVGLLPGALLVNEGLLFIERWVNLQTEEGESWHLPIAHKQGRYFVGDSLKEDEIWLTYDKNPNGSQRGIAGLRCQNVFALMPHPERAMYEWMGGCDGAKLFRSVFQ